MCLNLNLKSTINLPKSQRIVFSEIRARRRDIMSMSSRSYSQDRGLFQETPNPWIDIANTTTSFLASSAGGGDHHGNRSTAGGRAARPNVSLGDGIGVGEWRLVVIIGVPVGRPPCQSTVPHPPTEADARSKQRVPAPTRTPRATRGRRQ